MHDGKGVGTGRGDEDRKTGEDDVVGMEEVVRMVGKSCQSVLMVSE